MQFKWGWVARGGSLVAAGVVGYFVGRIVAIPGTTPFWNIAAQPLATLFAGIGAITAGCLAFYNGHRSREQEADHHRDSATQERESGLRERYTAAAGQLADTKPAIREAGVYAIAALTDAWYRFGKSTDQFELSGSEQQVCLNLLCSYLRANRSVGKSVSWNDESEEVAVRATIIAVLRERLGTWKKQGVSSVDLSGAYLPRARLRGINLSGADLSGADLSHAWLKGSNLERANLSDCVLTGTELAKARMHRALLVGAHASEADFTGAHLKSARLDAAKLDDVDFSRCSLASAQLGTPT
ncbi:hypothetical protein GS584_18890 [Rhodococcus hoagii]|nr:hypothetical protein [Prescottella equi]